MPRDSWVGVQERQQSVTEMPRDSWVGVQERQQSVTGGLATSSHRSQPHLTQLCHVSNITVRSWLRYLSPKIVNFVLIKIVFLQ